MKTSTLKILLVVATVLLALGLVAYSIHSGPTIPAPVPASKVAVVVAPAKPSTPITGPKRELGCTWSNDFLLFNADGDKLAVYLIGGDTQLFDLTAGKRLWWQKKGHTCFRASLQFNEKRRILNVIDYVSGPSLGHCFSMDNGKDLLEHFYPNYELPEVEADLDIQRTRYKAAVLDGELPKNIIPSKVMFIRSTGKLRCPSPDGSEVADTLPAPNAICRITNASGVYYEFAIDKPGVGARYSPDGKQLAVLHDDGTVALWQRGILPMIWLKVMDLPKE